MFVLMDIEWAKNSKYRFSPTQIAAMRVDDTWVEQDTFFERIRPQDSTFHKWKQVGFTGGDPSDFLYARSNYHVLEDLLNWLEQEDVLCFWTVDSMNILKSIYHLCFQKKLPQRMVDLSAYIFPYMKEKNLKCGNAYQIAAAFGTPAPGPKHNSQCDVQAIRLALAGLQYPAEYLLQKPPAPIMPEQVPKKEERQPATKPDTSDLPYQFDEQAGLLHRRGCSEIPDESALVGFPNLKYSLRKMLKPCPHCMAQEFRDAIRSRNQGIIDRTEYNFVYAANSTVFHRRNCKVILVTKSELRGSVYFNACEELGLRPCKLCNPTAGNHYRGGKKPKVANKGEELSRPLNREEQQSMIRFKKAKEERFSRTSLEFKSETEKEDFYTLTQPRFAFWAAAGYATFHRRDCRKMNGLTHLRGFSRYQDAIRAGYKPCKYCKPDAKQDILYSIPIMNRKRTDESINDLETLCKQYGFPCHMEDGIFYFSTSVGRWKLPYKSKPYEVHHINLVRSPDNEIYYHRQPRLFLSLLDTFEYICKHDKKLEERTYGSGSIPDMYASNE